MPYDPGLAHRLEELLADRSAFEQKKMFGGIGWLMNRHMCVGVWHDWLITRVGELQAAQIFYEPHVKPMDITGKPMKGWAMIAPEGIAEDKALGRHVDMAVLFVATLPPK